MKKITQINFFFFVFIKSSKFKNIQLAVFTFLSKEEYGVSELVILQEAKEMLAVKDPVMDLSINNF